LPTLTKQPTHTVFCRLTAYSKINSDKVIGSILIGSTSVYDDDASVYDDEFSNDLRLGYNYKRALICLVQIQSMFLYIEVLSQTQKKQIRV
jgi:hypothetical protein